MATAEEITQAAFAGIGIRPRWTKNPSVGIAYLRHAVVTRARAARPRPAARTRRAELDGLPAFAMLRSLSSRQREALVLRYYADLSEADTAAAMGVTRGALRRHTARGLAAIREITADP